jgi:hypothetical protein
LQIYANYGPLIGNLRAFESDVPKRIPGRSDKKLERKFPNEELHNLHFNRRSKDITESTPTEHGTDRKRMKILVGKYNGY